MARDTRLPIGGLAKRTGTKVNTIRFYEDIGLLPCAARTASGRRTYGDEDVGRLAFIRNARGLGFSIDEIRSLTALALGPGVKNGVQKGPPIGVEEGPPFRI